MNPSQYKCHSEVHRPLAGNKNMVISLRPGMEKDRDDCIRKLIDIQYVRNDQDFKRGTMFL